MFLSKVFSERACPYPSVSPMHAVSLCAYRTSLPAYLCVHGCFCLLIQYIFMYACERLFLCMTVHAAVSVCGFPWSRVSVCGLLSMPRGFIAWLAVHAAVSVRGCLSMPRGFCVSVADHATGFLCVCGCPCHGVSV